MTEPPAHLLVYAFPPGATFEGGLVGALERLESGGALRILGALFVQRDADSEEIAAIDLRGRGAGSAVGPLLGFRLDPAERRKATKRALADDSGGLPGAMRESRRPSRRARRWRPCSSSTSGRAPSTTPCSGRAAPA